MKRDRLFELLKSPCTPYVIAELLYVIVTIYFNARLNFLNQQLHQTFDVDSMVVNKDIIIATNLMSYNDNVPWYYLSYGILLIIIGFVIPIVSWMIDNASYKDEDIKGMVLLVICVIIVINVMIILLLSKALSSPIIIATLLICGIGTVFSLGNSTA